MEGGGGVETRGRGIKVICHLILRSTWFFLLTSSLPGGLVPAVISPRRGRVGFLFLFFCDGGGDGAV